MMKKPFSLLAIVGLSSSLFLSSCTQAQLQGAQLGALGGAALGAITGDDTKDVVKGAAVGAAVGVGVQAAREQINQQQGRYNTGGDYSANAPAQQTSSTYPVASKTQNPNHVISPHKPYKLVDISGMSSGSLAKDPTSGKIFRLP